MWWYDKSNSTNRATQKAAHVSDLTCAQLCEHSHLPWSRVVCTNWLGAPILNVRHMFKIVSELRTMGYEHFFISRRGVTDAAYGVQIWCAEPEMPFVIMLHASPIVSMRSYTADQFEEQIRTMCTWSTF